MTSTEQQLSNNVTRSASPLLGQDAKPKAKLIDALQDTGVQVLTPNDEAFEKELVSWNQDVVHRPAVIVQPEDSASVASCVKTAVAYGARLVIAGGRHGHDCLAEGALVMDLSKMRHVEVDAEAKIVTVDGGCKLGDMDRACKEYGLAAVTGTNPDTGVVGLSTAGGGGYMSRMYGMAVDNIVSAEVVLANGDIVLASHSNEYKDLLWGLSGAGSNFGVITKLSMKLHPVDKVFGGMAINVAPSAQRSKAILSAWRDWILEAPRSVMSMAVLPCGAPVVPMAVVEIDQQAVPQGDERAARKVGVNAIPNLSDALGGRLTGLTGIGKSFGALLSIKGGLKRMQYHSELQPMLESVQLAGHYYDASCLVNELSDEVVNTLVDFTRVKNVNSDASIIVFPLGGAVADAPADATAFWGGGRQPRGFWIIIEGKWKPDATGEKRAEIVGWVKALRSELAKFDVSDTAHTLDGNMEAELTGLEAVFGPNCSRVHAVKAKYDPSNFFKCNRNVEPKA